MLAPYDAEDCRGLLKAAIRDPDPVVFLENEIMYGQSFPVTSHVSEQRHQLLASGCARPPARVPRPAAAVGATGCTLPSTDAKHATAGA